jgi:hypothetical protein
MFQKPAGFFVPEDNKRRAIQLAETSMGADDAERLSRSLVEEPLESIDKVAEVVPQRLGGVSASLLLR